MRALDPRSLGEHLDRLYRAAWGLCGNREDAEDLVQETYVRVLARPRLLRGDAELAYLMSVLRNTFLTGRRTASRRPRTVAPIDELEPVDHRTGERPEDALQAQELFAAIAALPDDFRFAVVAVDIVGLSYREAGKALGAREATIATRLFRARQQLARLIEGEQPLEQPAPSRRQRAQSGHPHGGKDPSPGGVLP